MDQSIFFKNPEAKADISYWSKAACWTLEEAASLCFGASPQVVNWESVKDYVGRSRFASNYAGVRDFIERAKSIGKLSDPILPASFIAWTKQCEIEFPTELEAAVAARGQRAGHEKDMHPKERETLLKLLIAMAVASYGYNPSKFRNDAIKRITSHVYKVGLSINDDTVRKMLQEVTG